MSRCGVRKKGRAETRPYTGLSGLRARRLRLGQGLARNHFVAIGGQVDEGSDDHGHLLHVRLLDALVDVHVGMVGARVVVQRVLDELKAGEADGVEGQVVGAAVLRMVSVFMPRSWNGSIHAEKMGATISFPWR